jgi:hypothetical protein
MTDTIDVTVRWTDPTVYEADRTVSIEAMQEYYREQGYKVIAEGLPTMDRNSQAKWARVYLQSSEELHRWTSQAIFGVGANLVYRPKAPLILDVVEKNS